MGGRRARERAESGSGGSTPRLDGEREAQTRQLSVRDNADRYLLTRQGNVAKKVVDFT